MPPKQPKPSLKTRALRYLSLREHSRLELARKLASYVEPGEDVDAVLDWLEQNRFLSEQRFSESLIRRRSANFGNSRIFAELRSHQLDPALLAQSKVDLAESELMRAHAVWQKKFGHAETATPISDAKPPIISQKSSQNTIRGASDLNGPDVVSPHSELDTPIDRPTDCEGQDRMATRWSTTGRSTSRSTTNRSGAISPAAQEAIERRAYLAQQARYLAQRGFSSATIRAVIAGAPDEDQDLDGLE
jgi:regulatory protein